MIRASLILLAFLPQSEEASFEEKRGFADRTVDKAVETGLRVLAEWQEPDGSYRPAQSGDRHGTTSLALYTFLASGRSLKDAAPSRALDWLLSRPLPTEGYRATYETSLVAIALSYSVPQLEAGRRRERAAALLQSAADWLVQSQVAGGGWGYGRTQREFHDHSNSQFAVLGLRAAANAGAKVKKEVWEREVTHYKTSQLTNGGWGYITCYGRMGSRGSTFTMTAAGVMGLTLALGSVGNRKPAEDAAIKKGLAAMRDHWKLGLTNRLKSLGGIPYLLYSVERACMLTGQQKLGDIDWYVEGVWILLHRRDEAGAFVDGSHMGHERLAAHCFALLFLKRAFIPVATPSNTKPDAPTARSDPPVDKPREME